MSDIDDEEAAKNIAQHTSDLSLIQIFLEDNREWVRACLAVNPALLPGQRAILSVDKSRIVRTVLAASVLTPVDVLAKLGSDREWKVRYMIGYGKSLEVLKHLFKYSYRSVWPFESILERLIELHQESSSDSERADIQMFILDCYKYFSKYNQDSELQAQYRNKIRDICGQSENA